MILEELDVKKKIMLIIVAGSIILGVVAVGVMKINQSDNSLAISGEGNKQELNNSKPKENTEEKPTIKSSIYVHVTGAVEKPNLYELPDGARVYDAIKLAKPKKDADLDQLNLAEKLTDQMKITVPRKGEVLSTNSSDMQRSSNNSGGNSLGKVNINNATESQIEGLDGIGPTLAKRIIDYRQSKGGFHSISDLKNVSGIGEKKFAQLKNQVTL